MDSSVASVSGLPSARVGAARVKAGPVQGQVKALQAALGALGRNVDAAILEALLGEATLLHLTTGQELFAAGTPAAAVDLLLEGQLAIGRHSVQGDAQGESQILATLRAGEWIDAHSAWLGQHHGWSAWVLVTAREGAAVLSIPVAALVAAMQAPAWRAVWLGVLAQQVQRWSQQVDDLLHLDAEGRCALWLLRRAPAECDTACTIELRERKRTIAAQLGMTPETLSRVLRELSRKGLIEVQGYVVQLIDMVGLRGCTIVHARATP